VGPFKNVILGSRVSSVKTKNWIESLARFGHLAKGITYTVMGTLALQMALGKGAASADSEDAFQLILRQPLGPFFLGILAIGLAGYALWSLAAAAWNPDGEGMVRRASYTASGIGYGALAANAVQLLIGVPGSASSGSEQRWAARALAHPFGPWLLGLVGAAIIGAALVQLRRAYTGRLKEKLDTREMSKEKQAWTQQSGQLGVAARGIVYGLIGLLLIQAGLHYDPHKAGGLGQALWTLMRQPFGVWLLMLVAIGLVAYGLYMIALARYRRIRL
jgi:hypothetical protein